MRASSSAITTRRGVSVTRTSMPDPLLRYVPGCAEMGHRRGGPIFARGVTGRRRDGGIGRRMTPQKRCPKGVRVRVPHPALSQKPIAREATVLSCRALHGLDGGMVT